MIHKNIMDGKCMKQKFISKICFYNNVADKFDIRYRKKIINYATECIPLMQKNKKNIHAYPLQGMNLYTYFFIRTTSIFFKQSLKINFHFLKLKTKILLVKHNRNFH